VSSGPYKPPSGWHAPVMLAEVLAGLAVKTGGTYIDATVGDGGHAAAIMEQAGATGRLLGLDRDADALAVARARLAAVAGVTWGQANFEELDAAADAAGFHEVDGVLFDLGVRSDQLDRAERGFSFMHDGPLDMRMDQREPVTAADWVNKQPEAELARMIWQLGEERSARRIAAAIVARRAVQPFATTADLAAVAGEAAGGRRGRLHPATRTFMALRMAVNRELEAIEAGVRAALNRVGPRGRVAVLAYHSLEDRIVKRLFNQHVGRWESLAAGGRAWIGEWPRMERVTRKPLMPGTAECEANPRARSAKLRIVERAES
jgi:16S rRNA (cytosine1402-N4)-methyltransferase